MKLALLLREHLHLPDCPPAVHLKPKSLKPAFFLMASRNMTLIYDLFTLLDEKPRKDFTLHISEPSLNITMNDVMGRMNDEMFRSDCLA